MKRAMRSVFGWSFGTASVFALVAACSGTGGGGSGVGSGGSSGGASGSGGTAGVGGTAGSAGSGATGGFGAISGSGGSGGIPDGGACNAVTAAAKPAAANVLIVLDLSGSMSNVIPFPLGSRWQLTRNAFLQVLPGLPAGLRMGLVYFGHPTGTPGCTASDNGCCTRDSSNGGPDIPIQPLDTAQKTFITNWMNGTSPSNNNNTPTHDALQGAYDILTNSGLDGNDYALLITDGDENCGASASSTVKLAGDATSATPSIKTFVIGSPGSDGARQLLSDIAKAGQTPRTPTCDGSQGNTCHYDLSTASNFQTELQTALGSILGQTSLPCQFDIPSQDGGAFDENKVNVKYTNGAGSSADVLFDDGCQSASGQGWQYSTDKKQILLCQGICDVVKQDPNAKIDILFGCPTKPIN